MKAEDRIVREPECEAITGLSRTTRWRMIKDGTFPEKVQISHNLNGWMLSAVRTWLENRGRPIDRLEPVRNQRSNTSGRQDAAA